MKKTVIAAAMLLPILSTSSALSQTKRKANEPAVANPSETVKKYLKDNCNDPKRLEFVAFGDSFDFTGWRVFTPAPGTGEDRTIFVNWPDFKYSGTGIAAKYRTANDAGVLVLKQQFFFMDSKRGVFLVAEPKDVRTPSKDSGDQAMEAFLKGF